MLAFCGLAHKLLLENGTKGRDLWVPPVARGGLGRCSRNRAGQRSANRSSCCRTGPWRSSGAARRGVLQRGRLRGCSGSGPLRLPERPCTRTSSVTLRSWLRRLLLLLSQQRGGQERLLGVSSPARLSCCRLLAAKEKSLCLRVGHFTSVKAATFVPALTFPSHSVARAATLGVRKKRRGFPTTLHGFTATPPAMSIHSHTHS